jgi:3-methyl-2-oxobutanoate hydroxymethyltransferase
MKLDQLKKQKGVRRIVMLTAYDYQMAKILDNTGVDLILVGDSLGMVVLGYKDTKKVTMGDMIRHTRAVARGAKFTPIVSDMPIGSYRNPGMAVRNAEKLIGAGAHAVKLEGNKPEIINALISSGIQVMGHVGLLPQMDEEYKVKGKRDEEGKRIYGDAMDLDRLGVFSMVLECIPLNLAKIITEAVEALTIGIGAGPHCDGQVLVTNDILGMEEGFKPKHVKRYAQLNRIIGEAATSFMEEVRTGKFPDDRHSFH